jgi:hypothetical protein
MRPTNLEVKRSARFRLLFDPLIAESTLHISRCFHRCGGTIQSFRRVSKVRRESLLYRLLLLLLEHRHRLSLYLCHRLALRLALQLDVLFAAHQQK